MFENEVVDQNDQYTYENQADGYQGQTNAAIHVDDQEHVPAKQHNPFNADNQVKDVQAQHDNGHDAGVARTCGVGFLANKAQTFPSTFNKLWVSEDIVRREITSSNSFKKLRDMLTMGSSYLQGEPVLVGRDLKWSVMSCEDEDIFYTVSINPDLLRGRKRKRDVYKDYNYRCTCMSKKHHVALFCKHIAYVLMIYFANSDE